MVAPKKTSPITTQKQQVPDTVIPDEMKILHQHIADLQKQLADKDAKYKRALADYINLEKRVEDQAKRRIQIAVATFIGQLLEPLHNLELQFKHTKDGVVGVILKQMKQTFDQAGVKEVGREGDDFTSQTMEAIEMAEGSAGKVIKVLEKGYVLDWVVIKPARVVVGKLSEKQNKN